MVSRDVVTEDQQWRCLVVARNDTIHDILDPYQLGRGEENG